MVHLAYFFSAFSLDSSLLSTDGTVSCCLSAASSFNPKVVTPSDIIFFLSSFMTTELNIFYYTII